MKKFSGNLWLRCSSAKRDASENSSIGLIDLLKFEPADEPADDGSEEGPVSLGVSSISSFKKNSFGLSW